MKKVVLGVLNSRPEAEKMIQELRDIHVTDADISYLYRNKEGEVQKVDGSGDTTAGEGAAGGALVGGSVGALAGLATAVGLIPVIGPIFAAGPLMTALGIATAGAVGATATGAVTGAIAGGLIGALANIGVSDTEAKEYEARVLAGDILLAVETEGEAAVRALFTQHGASDIRSYDKR